MSMRRIVSIPGMNFGPHQPLLFLVGLAAMARNLPCDALTWEDDPASSGGSDELRSAWVNDRVGTRLAELPDEPVLLAGKSLGSYASVIAAERDLPAIWFTPLLGSPIIAAELAKASAPMLLIGGTGDPTWDSAAARRLSPYVLEIPDADHGLVVPGRPLADYGATLGRVGTAVEEFLDRWG